MDFEKTPPSHPNKSTEIPEEIHEFFFNEAGSVWYKVVTEPWIGINFLIRQRSEEIRTYSQTHGLEIRAGSLQSRKVLVGIVLFRFHKEGNVYLTAWDSKNPPSKESNPCHVLCKPAKLSFQFIGDSAEIEKTLLYDSPLSSFFRHLLTRAQLLPSWSGEDFLDALAEVYNCCKSTCELWEKFSCLHSLTSIGDYQKELPQH